MLDFLKLLCNVIMIAITLSIYACSILVNIVVLFRMVFLGMPPKEDTAYLAIVSFFILSYVVLKYVHSKTNELFELPFPKHSLWAM